MTGTDPLTHFDDGRAAMVDVGAKPVTARRAVAKARIEMQPETFARIRDGGVAKGDVLAVARVAGIQAAKRTGDLIPLCHPLPVDGVEIEFDEPGETGVLRIRARARTAARTGVEMEAMTAVSVAALTVYDMCKAAQKDICIRGVVLLEKHGGKSGRWLRDGHEALEDV
ncbi:MAG: cyclic pyranopterin monophosphate synthase MoaC [Pseudomonadota bacterium]